MQSYRIYKANSKGGGAASEFQLSFKKEEKYSPYMIFLTIAKQIENDENGNARFNWKEGIKVLLGIIDIGEILCVLEGRKDSLGIGKGLYHTVGDGTSKVINLNYKEGSFDFSVSYQNKEKENTRIYHRISDSEGIVLSILLKNAIERIFGWNQST